jgi:hypothetical protein
MSEENQERVARERARAMEALRHRHQQIDNSIGYTIQFGQTALKAPSIINMAGLAALLGFVSANAERLGDHIANIEQGFIWFAIGMLTAAMAAGGSYITQYIYTEAYARFSHGWQPPYVEPTDIPLVAAGKLMHAGTVALALLSHAGFFAGAVEFLELVKGIVS